MIKFVNGKTGRGEAKMLKPTWPKIDAKGSGGNTDKCAENDKIDKMVKLVKWQNRKSGGENDKMLKPTEPAIGTWLNGKTDKCDKW